MERLSDYLPAHRGGLLGRIFLAKQLTEAISAVVPGELQVVVKARTVVLNCSSAAYAQRLTIERRKLEAILTRLAGKGHNLTLKIRSSGSMPTDH